MVTSHCGKRCTNYCHSCLPTVCVIALYFTVLTVGILINTFKESAGFFYFNILQLIHGVQKVPVHLMITAQKNTQKYSNNPHTIDDLKMNITKYIRNVDRAILNTVFENTLRRVNKFLETDGGHFENYL
jgi:hypothetical protein